VDKWAINLETVEALIFEFAFFVNNLATSLVIADKAPLLTNPSIPSEWVSGARVEEERGVYKSERGGYKSERGVF